VANFGNSTLYQPAVYPVGAQPGSPGTVVFLGAPFSDIGSPLTNTAASPYPDPSQGLAVYGFKDFLDGTSNTMLVSETVIGFNKDARGFIWWGEAATFEAYLTPNSTGPDQLNGGCSYRYLLGVGHVAG
jgi:hypothetical protein